MIEATLDRTLVHTSPDTEETEALVQKALGEFNEPVAFENFIQRLVQVTGVSRPQIEDRFWDLLNTGQAVLTADLRVQVRR